MCGFIGYKEHYNDHYIKFRGQDHKGEHTHGGYNFKHFLLQVTGKLNPQPFVDGDIVVVYNGEIYNHKFKVSDGENIIPLYKKYGFHFPRHLDGEWAIALYDFGKDTAIFTTDLFKTKPFWYNDELEVASYQSGVYNSKKMPPNTIKQFKISTKELLRDEVVYEFDFGNQHKETYDDWIKAFKESIKKRGKDGCFIGLSSGYDSGAISCELHNLGIDFRGYSIYREENQDVLNKRFNILKDTVKLEINSEISQRVKDHLGYNMEKYNYHIVHYQGLPDNKTTIHQDQASIGLGYICELAQSEGRKVYLSGQGADEIMSDYSLFYGQSELKGNYPEDLKPWNNFFGSCQESYIAKEEYVGGAYNIETRYPFLDKQVVQEFLWLSTKLKNRCYKAPLDEYLTRNNFPFEKGVKRGFNI